MKASRSLNLYGLCIVAMLSVASAVSCHDLKVVEMYQKSSKVGEDGCYHFDVVFSDSLSVYDISLYSDFSGVRADSSFPVTVRWTSPKGWTFSERVYWNVSKEVVLYREDIKPREYGNWTMSVYVDEYLKLPGLGIIVERKDGSR